ncbi:MAG: hypothetical protein NZM12_14035, partial [Steroidobacteraceae bacterium]|nr:hypothetical protein [Steroidobacteraceae bacterium]
TAGLFLYCDWLAQLRPPLGDQLSRGPRPRQSAWSGAVFLVLALAASGLPPLSGFVTKLALLQAFDGGVWRAALWSALLLSSFAVALALARAASTIFWESTPAHRAPQDAPIAAPPRSLAIALAACSLASPALTIGAGQLFAYAGHAAVQLQDWHAYRRATLPNSDAVTRERRP